MPSVRPDLLLEGVSDVVYSTDASLRIRTWNRAAEALYGWSAAEVAGRVVTDVLATDYLGTNRRDINVALLAHGRWQGPLRHRRRDGQPLDVHVTLCLLRGADEGRGGLVAVARPLAGPVAVDLNADIGGADLHEVPGVPGAFTLHYQPELDLVDGRVVSFEALLRWHHPALGVLAPGAFLAEQGASEQLETLSAWTMFSACRQAARWHGDGLDVRVNLNLAGPQLVDPELVVRLRRAMTVTGLPTGALAVEIPAKVVRADLVHATQIACELRDAGLAVAVDDVSTDLSHDQLGQLPLESIKLDRLVTVALVDDGACQAFVAGTVKFANGRGVAVVAKGVETTEQLELFRSLGCDRAFGYLLGAPRPAAEMTPLVRAEAVAVGGTWA